VRAAIARRAGRVASIALLVATGSGALLTFQHLTGTGDLTDTSYGRLIVAKLATLILVLTLAMAADGRASVRPSAGGSESSPRSSRYCCSRPCWCRCHRPPERRFSGRPGRNLGNSACRPTSFSAACFSRVDSSATQQANSRPGDKGSCGAVDTNFSPAASVGISRKNSQGRDPPTKPGDARERARRDGRPRPAYSPWRPEA